MHRPCDAISCLTTVTSVLSCLDLAFILWCPVDSARRTLRTLRVSINLHQLHKAPLIIVRLGLLRVANPECSLHVDFVCSKSTERVQSVTSPGRTCRVLCSGLVGAAHDLREEAREPKTDRRHTCANDAHLAFDDRPQTGFEVIPGHVGRVGEVY